MQKTTLRSLEEQRNEPLAISLMLLAVLLFALLDSSVKFIGSSLGVPIAMIMWLRFAGHVALNTAYLGTHGSMLRPNKPLIQFLRSCCMLGATAFNFAAVQYLQLDQSITIFFLTPLIVASLAGPFLGEWVGWRRLLAILVGFAGVIVVMRPGFGGIHWAVLLSFGATLSYALYSLATRYLAAHDPIETTLFWTPMVGVVATAPFAYASWEWSADPFTWAMLAALGVFGFLGHLMHVKAHRLAPAPVLSPFTYSSLIWMVILGYLLFGDLPDAWTLTGGAIVIGSGLYLFYRERQTAMARARGTAHSAP
ncbi:MAG: EamA family transporter [Rhizobiales bacterium]|nr:EamA family transporter [Hyphomicrobiales bacterium]